MQKFKKWIVPTTAVIFLFPSLLLADTTSISSSQSVDERLKALEHEIQVLKRVQEVNKEMAIKKDQETPLTIAGKDGFGLKSRDGDFTLKFKGQIQADGRYYIKDDTAAGANTYLLRRVRPTLEGTVYKYVDYKLMPDFGGGTTSIQDAFIDFKYWPAASLRVGKFKSPVGLERLQSDQNKMFIEDSLTTNLVPNRDIGVDLHGDLFDNTVSYDLGVFNGVADGSSGDTDNHDDKDFVARIFLTPFKNSANDWLSGLGAGVAASVGRAHGSSTASSLPSYRSGGQQTFFSYNTGAFAYGEHNRITPQAYYYKGPVGALVEWVFASQDIRFGTTQSATVKNQAWAVSASYALTGEDAAFNGLIPRTNFDPKKKTWGAFEAVTRLSNFKVDQDAFANYSNPLTAAKQATAWAIGLNWYLNKNLKMMTDFEQTFFDGGRASGGNRRNENAFLNRLQVVF